MEFETTKSDFFNFYALFYLNRVKKLSIGIFPLLLIVSFNIYTNDFEIWHFILAFIILSIISFLILFCLPFGIFVFRLNKLVSKNFFFFEKKSLKISLEGINIDSKSNKKFLKWENISAIEKAGNFLYLISIDKKSVLIPGRFFYSKSDMVLFYKNIKEKLVNKSDSNSIKLQKSIYNWGYLGLIPIIGFFVGIVLIIRGLFQYKDKKLIIIGIGGVLFTSIIYSLLVYQTEFSDSSKQTKKDLCISNLNNLVRDIEFYKIQNGNYPDSLEQIKKNNQFVFIYDPLFFKVAKKSDVKYYYKKISDKYTLFSIGADGIPDTSDDIYPDIINSNSDKLGLIKNK